MKKYRINTTVSSKHHALLKKHAEKYASQQKTIEHALELLDNNPSQSSQLSEEDQVWLQIGRDFRKVLIFIQKDSYQILLDNSDMDKCLEYLAKQKPVIFLIEYYYRKPLKECSLKEIMDAIVLKLRIQNSCDMVNYTDDGDYYSLNISHSFGPNQSKILQIGKEGIFKAYGVKTESKISDRGLFMKIYKNLNEQ